MLCGDRSRMIPDTVIDDGIDLLLGETFDSGEANANVDVAVCSMSEPDCFGIRPSRRKPLRPAKVLPSQGAARAHWAFSHFIRAAIVTVEVTP